MDVSSTGLRVLRQIAESGSFTAAATRLGYTQSAVSRQAAALERSAGTALFERRPDGVSLLPEPLSFTSVLTFHDALELFLIVTAEHLGAVLKDRDPFIKRFFEGLHPSNFPGEVELQGQYGIKRLNELRNGVKHTAGFPGPNAIADVKADTAHFFLENPPRVFGFAFDDIDLAEAVQHDQTRTHLKTAAQLNSEGSFLEAMGTLAMAFQELMNDQTKDVHAPRGWSAYRDSCRKPRRSRLRWESRDSSGAVSLVLLMA
ncbi:helix-turn-helix domain-containing protein, partial [Streptomyces sp. NPDC003480]